jgi:hypothetical protein
MKKLSLKTKLYDKCMRQIIRVCNLRLSEEGIKECGNNLDWDEFIVCELNSIETLPSGQPTDGLLLFGDGTLEIRDTNTQDAYNWYDYSVEDLEFVWRLLSTMQLEVGTLVKWNDPAISEFSPEEREFQLNREFVIVDIINKEKVLIADEYGEAEVSVEELECINQ